MKHQILATAAAALALAACATTLPPAQSPLSRLPQVAEVDARYQSYNIEMVEVTGGRFWAPFGGPADERYRMRPPTNLADPRLRALARQLGPAFLRVSGTWANSTYLPAEAEVVTAPPTGFNQVLTRDQWRGVVAFAHAVDARIVTSFPASAGARHADGSWNPAQAQRLLDLTRTEGGSIYAAEMFNEPTMPQFGAFPEGYNAQDFGRDFRIFQSWAREAAPEMLLAGTGGASEGTILKHGSGFGGPGALSSDDLLAANPGSLDILAYHHYGTASPRCGEMALGTPDAALSDEFLALTLADYAHYAGLRDRYEPGKPLWLNETAQAACGGAPWASTFRDSFRYLHQLGALAQHGVQMVAHNTLAASDYGLIDQDSLAPRPNYWAAVLWRRTMGTRVLAAPASPSPQVRLFAHCLPIGGGGVGLLAINTGETAHPIPATAASRRWVLTGEPLDTREVKVNGVVPALTAQGDLSGLEGIAVSGSLTLPAQSIAFLAAPDAANPACY